MSDHGNQSSCTRMIVKPLWCYLGLIYLVLGIGILPWVLFQLWNVNQTLDWDRKAEPNKHDQVIMHDLAHWSRSNYEFALKCFMK